MNAIVDFLAERREKAKLEEAALEQSKSNLREFGHGLFSFLRVYFPSGFAEANPTALQKDAIRMLSEDVAFGMEPRLIDEPLFQDKLRAFYSGVRNNYEVMASINWDMPKQYPESTVVKGSLYYSALGVRYIPPIEFKFFSDLPTSASDFTNRKARAKFHGHGRIIDIIHNSGKVERWHYIGEFPDQLSRTSLRTPNPTGDYLAYAQKKKESFWRSTFSAF